MAIDEPGGSDGPALSILASKRFPQTQVIKYPLTAFSSPHDLLAVVTTSEDILVFRVTSGQLAFTAKRENSTKKDIEVTTISWKADGTCLGAAWTDGKYAIFDGSSGKQLAFVDLGAAESGEVGWRLALLRPEDEDGEDDAKRKAEAVENPDEDGEEGRTHARAEVLGWMGHYTTAKSESAKLGGPLTTEEWLDGLEEGTRDLSLSAKAAGQELAQLSRAITTLDVTRILPRLSAVQNHITKPGKQIGKNQKVPNVWQTQQGTDSMFEVGKDPTTRDLVESLLVCQDDGTIQVLTDETVSIGSCSVTGKPLLHAAHPHSSSHSILSQAEDESYLLNVVDLPLSTFSGPLLHVIATNTKRMQTLLDYVVQTVRCIQYDFSFNIKIPAKFLQSLGAFVEATDLPSASANLYHLAMTGTFPDELHNWIKDTVGGNGQKRWEDHMNALYRDIQDHLFVNLLPAIDRFSVATTTLRGHATFYEGSSKFDCPSELFTNVLDQLDCLRAVAQKMLLLVQTEQRQYRAFNKWLKMQIEVQVAGPFTSSALETESREVPALDYSLLLAYIRDIVPIRSRLEKHIVDRPGMEGQVAAEDFWANHNIRDLSYDNVKEVLQRENNSNQPMSLSLKDVQDQTSLLNIPTITCALAGHVRLALEKITDWQSRTLPPAMRIPLDFPPDCTIHDMTMFESITRLLSSHSSDPSQVVLTTVDSSTLPTTTFVPLPPSTELLAMRWIGHTDPLSFLTLSKVISDEADGESHTEIRRYTISADETQDRLIHIFPGNASFKPQSLCVGGRKGKMVCVVFGNDGREWRVLDLDAGAQVAKEDDAGMEIDD